MLPKSLGHVVNNHRRADDKDDACKYDNRYHMADYTALKTPVCYTKGI